MRVVLYVFQTQDDLMKMETNQNFFLSSNVLPSNAKTTLIYNFFGTLLELCDPQSNRNKPHAKKE
jgi:hypothetical protein